MSKVSSNYSRAWSIWLIAALFYAYEFFLRISPEVMVAELMRAFSVDAAAIGNVSAYYYWAYALMQIPVGMLLDRFGSRRLLSCAAFTVAIGSALFATTSQVSVAEFGRILMGVGSAFSFVGCLKLARNWFPVNRIAIIIGLTNMLGVLGALFGQVPLAELVKLAGWRPTMLFAGIIGAIIALLIAIVVKDRPKLSLPASTISKHLTQGLNIVLRSPVTWLTAIYGGLIVAPISAFSELWGVLFLVKAAHLSKVMSALIASSTFTGIAVGGPTIGWLSGRIGKRKPLMFIGALGALLSLSSIIYLPHISEAMLVVLLFCFGFFSSNMLLIFAINTENNPKDAAGVAIGFTNMLVMAGGTIFQPLVGFLLDQSKPASATTAQFSLSAYHHALWLLPACQIIAFILLFFMRETYCKACDNQQETA